MVIGAPRRQEIQSTSDLMTVLHRLTQVRILPGRAYFVGISSPTVLEKEGRKTVKETISI